MQLLKVIRWDRPLEKCRDGISHDDFDTNVMFFSVSPIIYLIIYLTFIPFCLFCSIIPRVICIVHSISPLDELFLLLEQML